MLDAAREPLNRMPGLLADTTYREEDQAFLAKLQRLDRDAWDRFYLQHRRLVRGVVAGYLGYSADLDDVAQQVFMTAVRLVQSDRVRLRGDESGLRAWLATIAGNLAHTEERRRRKRAGHFRLNAHVAGDPYSKQYCVDNYTPGAVVQPSDMKSQCWSGTGETLASFRQVDTIGLMRVSEPTPVSFDFCVNAITMD
jgi:RNA polymerase sigma-70 factor (ECF subfamily)